MKSIDLKAKDIIKAIETTCPSEEIFKGKDGNMYYRQTIFSEKKRNVSANANRKGK